MAATVIFPYNGDACDTEGVIRRREVQHAVVDTVGHGGAASKRRRNRAGMSSLVPVCTER